MRTPEPSSSARCARRRPWRARTAAASLVCFAVLSPALAHAGGEGGASLDLMIHDTGIAFGNAPRVNGVRLNFQDRYLEQVNGLNFTIWSPTGDVDNVGGEVNGLALGIAGPVADRLHGVQVGLAAVVSNERVAGLSIGGLAVVSEGAQYGVGLAGLAVVSEGVSTGIGAAGLAYVSEGELNGVHVAGLATVGSGGLRGVHVGGLAAVSETHASGIGVAGLATVSEGPMDGIGVAGLATVSERLRGVAIAGLASVSEQETRGIAIAAGVTGATDLNGIAIAAYNRYEGVQRGLTIGIFNRADELHGAQIGLLNRADNNPPPFRWLPVLNAHF